MRQKPNDPRHNRPLVSPKSRIPTATLSTVKRVNRASQRVAAKMTSLRKSLSAPIPSLTQRLGLIKPTKIDSGLVHNAQLLSSVPNSLQGQLTPYHLLNTHFAQVNNAHAFCGLFTCAVLYIFPMTCNSTVCSLQAQAARGKHSWKAESRERMGSTIEFMEKIIL